MSKFSYSYGELLEYCKEHKIRTPVSDLIYYGIRCNWLKKNRKPFKSLGSFVNYYNSVWIKKNKDSDKGYWASKWKKGNSKNRFKEKLKEMSKENRQRKEWYIYMMGKTDA